MKICNVFLLTVGLGVGILSSASVAASGATDGNLVVEYHFSGIDRILSDTNAQSIRTLSESSVTRQMRGQMLAKLSAAPQQLFATHTSSTPAHTAPLFDPLWEDVARNESHGELHGRGKKSPEWVLAVRLTDERAGLWSSNLSKASVEWGLGAPMAVKTPGSKGWLVKGVDGSAQIEYVRVRSWVVVGVGTRELRATKALVERLEKQDAMAFPEAETCLTVQSDLGGLSRWWTPPMLRQFKKVELPSVKLACSFKGGNLFSSGSLTFGHSHKMELQPWQIPMGLLRDPLISFTAVQGIHSWLKELDWIKTLQINNPPDQAFSWAQEYMPFMTFVAAPMNNASNAIPEISRNLPILIQHYYGTNRSGTVRYFTNQNQVVWSGLPAIAPFATAVNISGREFLYSGCVFPWDSTNPPPTELLAQVAGRTNLVYYDWEVTGARLSQVRVLEQIRDMVFGTTSVFDDVQRSNSFGNAWLTAAAPVLGNAVTEISTQSPKEWTLKRKSSVGFTAYELLQLVKWMDDPQFPLFGHKLEGPERSNAK